MQLPSPHGRLSRSGLQALSLNQWCPKRFSEVLETQGGAARKFESGRPLPTTSNCPATNRSDSRP
jgi:hypothetical protein